MKKNMKHIGTILVVLLLVSMACPLTVQADVIYEPRDSFYSEHFRECEYVCRYYTAKGPNGTVTIYESPESDRVEATIANGETVYVSYTYEDSLGIIWGCCEDWDTEMLGWAPMDYLEVIYDEISFSEEYGALFIQESGTLDEKYLGQIVYFWAYPGSTDYETIDLTGGWTEHLPTFDTVYTDEKGTRWGKGGYYYGHRNYWINLDNPTLEPPAPNEDEATPPETIGSEVSEIVPQESESLRSVKLVLILAVVAVVVFTWLMLVKLKGKEK